MTYEELVQEFFERYDKPVIEQLTIGFAGIDPPLKVNPAELDHEKLDNLLGGSDSGHYHLTKAELEKLRKLINYPPHIYAGQIINVIASEEMTPYEVQGENVRM